MGCRWIAFYLGNSKKNLLIRFNNNISFSISLLNLIPSARDQVELILWNFSFSMYFMNYDFILVNLRTIKLRNNKIRNQKVFSWTSWFLIFCFLFLIGFLICTVIGWLAATSKGNSQTDFNIYGCGISSAVWGQGKPCHFLWY